MKISITESQLKGIIKEVSVKKEDRVKIYQDENIVVVAPLTHRSSCKYGSHTKWCTAVPSNDEHFNHYIRHGVLIYFIIRSPHKNTTKTEYKFAYYHSFSPETEELKGWYDMSDNFLDFNNQDLRGVDKNLIKFLIPDGVFNLVKNYVKEQRPLWVKKLKETKGKIAEYFINDINNTMNTIVNDSDWFISYRTVPFDNYEFYKSNNFPYPFLSSNSHLSVFYVNKKTTQIYKQNLEFHKDLRNYEFKKEKFLPKIEDIYNDNPSEEMISVFDKYYPQILNTFFKVRKKNYNPTENSYVYLPPQYVQKGDAVAGMDNTHTIHSIGVHPRNGGLVINTVNSKGEIRNGVYYDNVYGIGMIYDKDKHNPI
jgi:hypothetical protein